MTSKFNNINITLEIIDYKALFLSILKSFYLI